MLFFWVESNNLKANYSHFSYKVQDVTRHNKLFYSLITIDQQEIKW